MIEDATLKYLGIYPEVIERVDEICERVCEKYGIDSDDAVWEYVKQDFDEQFNEADLTGYICYLIFKHTRAALVESGMVVDSRIDWYINGICSSFYIDGEEV